MHKRSFNFLLALASSCSAAWAGTATVDGVGGVDTSDPTFTKTYSSVGAALTAANAAAGDHTIEITTNGPIDESAGLNFNADKSITVNGAAGGTHLRITPTGVGASGGSCGIAIQAFNGRTVSLNRLIVTPGTGAAGIVSARGLQIFNSTATAITGTVNLTDVMFTALRPTGHTNAGQALTDPFTQYESTRANRNANTRSFNGGGATSVIEISNVNSTNTGVVTVNMVRSGVCHATHNAASAVGGGLVQSRTQGLALNILEGCYFTFNDIAGIRTTAFVASSNASIKIDGTPANPVICYRNGWQEDTANTGRNEGVLLQVGANATTATVIDNLICVQNFQEGLEVTGGSVANVTNSIFAQNQYDLDPGTGTAPNVGSAGNILLQSGVLTVADSTLFDNVGNSANDNAIRWTGAAGSSLTTNRVIIAGAGDQVSVGGTGVTWTDNNTAVVTAGSHALDSTPVVLGTNNRTSNYSISADPDFASTTFSPAFTFGSGNSVPSDYLLVRSSAYRASRTAGAADVRGANSASPLPVSVSAFDIE